MKTSPILHQLVGVENFLLAQPIFHGWAFYFLMILKRNEEKHLSPLFGPKSELRYFCGETEFGSLVEEF